MCLLYLQSKEKSSYSTCSGSFSLAPKINQHYMTNMDESTWKSFNFANVSINTGILEICDEDAGVELQVGFITHFIQLSSQVIRSYIQ